MSLALIKKCVIIRIWIEFHVNWQWLCSSWSAIYLPITSNFWPPLLKPFKFLSFPGVQTPICAVTGSQFLTKAGWSELRNPIDSDVPFRLFRDEGRTFIQVRPLFSFYLDAIMFYDLLSWDCDFPYLLRTQLFSYLLISSPYLFNGQLFNAVA